MGRNIHEQNDEKNIHSPPANSRLARGAEAYGIAKDRRGKRGKLLANWKYDTSRPIAEKCIIACHELYILLNFPSCGSN